ncbi:MAG: sulfatase-like hydrolase/transferase [Rhodothermales bacterium]
MNVRDLSALSAALLMTILALTGCRRPEPAAPPPPPGTPNILILFTDDQRADAIGAYDNPAIRTPTMDSLIGTGFSFRRNYVMGSHHGAVCAPSRAMLMSGRSLFNVYDNLDTVATYPEMMRGRGYTTFGTGKWHNSQASFARSFSVGRRVFFGGMADHFKVPVRDLKPDGTYTDPDTMSFSAELYADAAIDFLAAQSGSDTPFLAYVAFSTPHDPRTPPGPYAEMYPPDAVPLPANFMPAHPFHNGWLTGRDEQLAAWPRTESVIRAQLAEYYGLVTHTDAQIGRILAALRRAGKADNTLVVFAADNGLALGSHGLLGKQSLYEHSSRVPLVFAGPGIPHGETDAYTYLYDIFPTLVRRLGLPTVEGSEGVDLAPLWRGEEGAVRPSLFTTYEDLMRSVHEGDWKLIRYPKLHYNQLFNLAADPNELNNLAESPDQAERVAHLMELLADWQQRAHDPHPLTSEERMPMEYDYRTFTRSPDRWQPESVRKKYFGE